MDGWLVDWVGRLMGRRKGGFEEGGGKLAAGGLGGSSFWMAPISLWVKNRYPKWNPGTWKHGPKPAVPWLLNFEPYPFVVFGLEGKPKGRRCQNCPRWLVVVQGHILDGLEGTKLGGGWWTVLDVGGCLWMLVGCLGIGARKSNPESRGRWWMSVHCLSRGVGGCRGLFGRRRPWMLAGLLTHTG